MMESRIVLIGYMGTGKTTIGRLLSERIGYGFIDMDWMLEQRHHKTINELFAQGGELFYREIERDMLQELISFERVVIATGGGVPCFYNNMTTIKESSFSVFLNGSDRLLAQRLIKAKMNRPLIKDVSDQEIFSSVQELLTKRLPYYQQADMTVDIDTLSKKEVVDTIESTLNNIQ